MQKDNDRVVRLNGSPLTRVRKSYSAESLIMKSILQEVSFKNMDLDVSRSEELTIVLEADFKRKKRIEDGAALAVPHSPPSVIPNHITNSAHS